MVGAKLVVEAKAFWVTNLIISILLLSASSGPDSVRLVLVLRLPGRNIVCEKPVEVVILV